MSNKEIDYAFLILDFLKSYKFYHSKQETIDLMKDMISKKHISILTKDLEAIGKEKISEELSKIVLSQIRSDIPNKVDLTELLPIIVQNNIKVIETYEKEKNNPILKKALITGVVSTLSLASVFAITKKEPKAQETLTYTSQPAIKNLELNTSKILELENHHFNKENSIDEKQFNQELIKKQKELEKQKKQKQEHERKKATLNHFNKCKSIKTILKRQKELENLHLTKKDKLYQDCKLSAPLQRFIYEQSVLYEIPTDFLFSIIYTETRGNFNSSGEKSYNAPGNYDLGLTQQNTKSSVKNFADTYHINFDDACEWIQNNDYVNVASACLEIEEIKKQMSKFDAEEYAGLYNGWINWRGKEISRHYVDIFSDCYQNIFTKYHEIEKIESNKTKVKK